MNKFQKIVVVGLAVALSATAAFGASVVVNFDNLNNGDVITNQYAGVTFSSTSGNVNYVTTQPQYLSTPPNFLCSGPASGGIDCAQETFLNFSSPVNGLNFDGRSEEHTSELQSLRHLVCRLLLEKKKTK